MDGEAIILAAGNLTRWKQHSRISNAAVNGFEYNKWTTTKRGGFHSQYKRISNGFANNNRPDGDDLHLDFLKALESNGSTGICGFRHQ